MEPDDYEAMLEPRDPAWTDPTQQDLAELSQRLRQMAHRTAEKVSVRAEEFSVAGDEARTVMWDETRDVQLALLRVLREVPALVEELAAEAADRAGEHGASYPQLGAAYGISRQAARKKWPDVVHLLAAPLPEPVVLEMAGGEAYIHFDPEEGGWAWRATGANGRQAESGEGNTTDTSHEAAAAAGVFLTAQTEAARRRRHQYSEWDHEPVS